MDPDGVPDPFVKISVGKYAWETDVLWNTPDPAFHQTFSGYTSLYRWNSYSCRTYDDSMNKIEFQMYDQNQFAFLELRIGYAIVSIPEIYDLALDSVWDQWLDLQPNSKNESIAGKMRVQFHVSKPTNPGLQITLLVIGVILTFGSLFVGFYKWRSRTTMLKTA